MGAEDDIEKQGQELTETREQGLGDTGLRGVLRVGWGRRLARGKGRNGEAPGGKR